MRPTAAEASFEVVEGSEPPKESIWEKLGWGIAFVVAYGLTIAFYGVIALAVAGLIFGWWGDNSNKSANVSASQNLSSVEARDAVKHYYVALDAYQYRKAWNYLGSQQQAAVGGLDTWRRPFKNNFQTNLTSETVTPLNPTSATVAVTLNTLDYDACNNKVWQTFSGTWTVSLDGGKPLLESANIAKTSGRDPVLTVAECQTILPPPPASASNASGSGGGGGGNCDPSYPDQCLEDGIGDYDCSSSFDSGYSDGPNEAYGPLTVTGSDPFGLDRDGNGIGCEEG